ncbi:OmpH family outer membrane protein [Bacteroidia bacterium]|nr:OmpH family outer membrane protein [Bacteroidia bacterium]
MKKLFVILMMVCAAGAVNAQTKVGHINSSELIDLLPEADTIQTRLLAEQEQWQKILADKETEAKTKYTALMQIIEDPAISNSVKEIKSQEVENLQKQYQELQQRANEELQKKQQELLTPLLDKVKKTIAEVAKVNGYAYVMDTTEGSGIIYSDSSFDLMPLVKAKLGVK